MRVTPGSDGNSYVVDHGGHHVAGPFERNADAWAFIDALEGPRRRPAMRKSEPTATKRGAEPPRVTKRQMRRAAGKAPRWIRDIAAARFDPIGERAHRDHKLGSFGAASDVRHIDPAEYLKGKGPSA